MNWCSQCATPAPSQLSPHISHAAVLTHVFLAWLFLAPQTFWDRVSSFTRRLQGLLPPSDIEVRACCPPQALQAPRLLGPSPGTRPPATPPCPGSGSPRSRTK